MKIITINGATGMIGSRITEVFRKKKYSINILTRNITKAKNLFQNYNDINYIDINDKNEITEVLYKTNVLINLAGASIGGKRWTEKYKKEIYNSRILSTKFIAELIKHSDNKPELFINASAIGYYGQGNDKIFTEKDNAGNDFIANLCNDWENEADKVSNKIRTIKLRTGLVLDNKDGALVKLIKPFKFYIGGILGTGKQYQSWIHIKDLINILIYCIDNSKISGPVNAVSPNPVTNKEFSATLGSILKKPSFFIIPSPVLKIIIGEFANFLLTGQRVYPEYLINEGFKFEFENIRDALNDLVSQ